jgi:rubrerythrin
MPEKEQQFCKLLDDAIKDEQKAPPTYDEILKALTWITENTIPLLPKETQKHEYALALLADHIVTGIKIDEIKHKKLLEALYDINCRV